MKRLSYNQLQSSFNIKELNFKSTEDIKPYNGIIGQKRAQQALQFGLNMKAKGYNIYISGPSGSGKTTLSKLFSTLQAKKEKIPPDICYIYNFKNPKNPKVLKLEPGKGKELKEDLEDLINVLITELPKKLKSKDIEIKKNDSLKEYRKKRDKIINKMEEEVKDKEVKMKTTDYGIYFMPLIKNKVVTEDIYNKFSKEEKKDLNKKTETIENYSSIIMAEIKEHEKFMIAQIESLEYSESLFTIGYYISDLLEKYKGNDKIINYLLELKEDILENLEDFVLDYEDEEEDISSILSCYSRKNNEEIFSKYKVNVLVDNSNLKYAPVLVAQDITYSNIIGDINYETEHGNFVTDFMKIKPGLLHKANGGYLILKVQDILNNSFSWDYLCKFLRTRKIVIEPLKENSTGIFMNLIEPEPVYAEVKIILIGTDFFYNILDDYDLEFKKLFRIKVDFDYEIEMSKENIKLILGFIKNYINNNNCLDFTENAVKEIFKYSSRIAENRNKFISQFSKITEIILESSNWAKLDKAKIVTYKYVSKAIKEKEYRLNLYEEKLNNMLLEDILMINTTGKKIGQINSLAVLNLDDYSFGKPTKISATTYVGKAGIINIEKEAKMSGSIHDKGIQVLIGYLGNVFAQKFPLSLSCRICFEQNYNEIDGDSASSTELYAILSSLSEIPIKQNIAVTGSINQYGEIQPIGGVTYKVEGFFDICNKRGLTGNQGVIIPIQNIKDLVLKDEVMEAIKNNKFHIYPIKNIEEGIEILTDIPFEVINKNKLSKYCIKYKIIRKLKKFFKVSFENI